MKIPMPTKGVSIPNKIVTDTTPQKNCGIFPEERDEFLKDLLKFNEAWGTNYVPSVQCSWVNYYPDMGMNMIMYLYAYWEYQENNELKKAMWTRTRTYYNEPLIDFFCGDWSPVEALEEQKKKKKGG